MNMNSGKSQKYYDSKKHGKRPIMTSERGAEYYMTKDGQKRYIKKKKEEEMTITVKEKKNKRKE